MCSLLPGEYKDVAALNVQRGGYGQELVFWEVGEPVEG